MSSRPDVLAESLGGGLVEEGPDDRGRAAGKASKFVGREEPLRQEPLQTVMVDLADKRSHKIPIARSGDDAKEWRQGGNRLRGAACFSARSEL